MAKRSSVQKRARKKTKPAARPARQRATRRAKPVARAPRRTSTKERSQPPTPPAAEATRRDGRSHLPANFHAMYDRGLRAARGLAAPAARAVSPSGRRLARAVPGLEVYVDETTRLPNLIISQSPGASLSPRRAAGAVRAAALGTPEGAVAEWVNRHADLWQLSDRDASTVEVVSVSQPRADVVSGRARARRGRTTPGFDVSKLRTVNLVQRVDGVEVFNSDTTGAVNDRNEVIAVAGQFFHGAAASGAARSKARSRAAGADEAPSSVEDAIARAAFDLTNVTYARSDFLRTADQQDAGQYRFYDYTSTVGDGRPVFERPVRVKDVMFPLGDGQFVRAYYMELWIKGFPAFSYVMDAVDTPDLLYRKNLTSHATFKYRVHNTGDALFRPLDGPAPGTPHPTSVPDGFQAPTVPEKLIAIESLLAGDPWLPPGATTTDGNNCMAYADLAPPRRIRSGRRDGQGEQSGRFRLHLRSQQAFNRRRPTCRTAWSGCSST